MTDPKTTCSSVATKLAKGRTRGMLPCRKLALYDATILSGGFGEAALPKNPTGRARSPNAPKIWFLQGIGVSVAMLALALNLAGAAELKPACRGLMIREYHPPEKPWPFIDSVVVQLGWDELETAAEKFDGPGWATIEQARKVPSLKIRLRILCGIHAPSFVKQLGGPGLSDPEHGTDCSQTGGIAVWNRHDSRSGSIPRFWLPEVLDRYERLMTEVAHRYEDTPEICEVVASGAMTVYAEPFYRAHTDTGSNERLFKAGLNFEKDKAAHERVIRIHAKLFQKTRTSLAINAWDIIDASASHQRSNFKPVFEFANWARQLMGQRLVLQNNGTGTDANWHGASDSGLFPYLRSIGGPKGFQTRTLARLGGNEAGLLKTLEIALQMGANFVELPSGYQKFSQAKLKEYDAKLRVTK